MNPKDRAVKLQQDFDDMMGNYRRMTQMLLDGLAPNVPQERRNELRRLFTPFVKETAGKKKPSVDGGGPPVE